MLPSFKIFCFCFLMLITDNIFLFTAALMTAPIYVNMWINVDTVCFQRTKAFLWLWGRILVKLTEFSSFAFNCYSFGSLNFNFNRSKIKISYSGGASELCLFIRLLPNVSHVIECIFKEISDFLNLSIYIILVNILLILSKYRSAFPPYKRKTFFVADCFNRRFSCFGYYEFLIQNFLIFVRNCPFLLFFLFLL